MGEPAGRDTINCNNKKPRFWQRRLLSSRHDSSWLLNRGEGPPGGPAGKRIRKLQMFIILMPHTCSSLTELQLLIFQFIPSNFLLLLSLALRLSYAFFLFFVFPLFLSHTPSRSLSLSHSTLSFLVRRIFLVLLSVLTFDNYTHFFLSQLYVLCTVSRSSMTNLLALSWSRSNTYRCRRFL